MSGSRIITFEGTALVSKAIGLFTGSNQSHVAWQTPDGTLWEAVDPGFMATNDPTDELAPFRKYHGKGTVLHFFEFKTPLTDEQERMASEFLHAIKDQPYGFRTLFTFMLRPGRDPERDRVICSEAVLGISIACRSPLVERMRPWSCNPRDIFHSAITKWTGTKIL